MRREVFSYLRFVAFSFAFVLAMFLVNSYQLTQGSPQVAGASTMKASTVVPTETSSPLTTTLNNYRISLGKTEVVQDTRLTQLAEMRLSDMYANQYYAHQNKSGETFVNYFASVNLAQSTPSCENLLMTQTTDASEMLQEWKNSPAHNACMLRDDYNAVGFAEGVFDGETGQRIAVMILVKM